MKMQGAKTPLAPPFTKGGMGGFNRCGERTMLKTGLLVAAALWLIVASPTWGSAEPAQGVGVTEPAPASDPGRLDLPSYREPQSPLPGAGVTSQIFTALGTVLGLIALGVYLYKRVALRGPRGVHQDGTIQVLSRTHLGPKESLCLVRVGTDVLLLGQTSAGITLLHTLPPSPSAAASDRRDGEEAVDPLGQSEQRQPSEFARERSAVLAGLEGRLKRLNKLWGTEASD